MQKSLLRRLKILQRSRLFFLAFVVLAGCSGQFSGTVKAVESFDAKYSINLSDYESGLVYFNTHERSVVLNPEDYPAVIDELRQIGVGRDADSQAYVNFRVSLLEAEQLYKSAFRRPFAGYDDVVMCSRKEEQKKSISELFSAINRSNDAISYYQSLGSKSKEIAIDPSWIDFMRSSNNVVYTKGMTNLGIIEDYCSSGLSG